MTTSVINIKINIPPCAPNILDRPHLTEKLEKDLQAQEGLARQLTLISAPAGFGKTTLARNWLVGKENRSAWYTLDHGDNERQRFWFYLVSALASVEPNLGRGTIEILRSSALGDDKSMDSATLLAPLLNEIFTLEKPLYLVIDDYHLINSSIIHQDMIFFIENLPPYAHLIVTSRSEPPWPLARWRARGKMAEARQKHLRFSREETIMFFKGRPGLLLSTDQIRTLHEKTEGWITGLQLAAISLADSSDPRNFIDNFAGSHRHVFHFLSEEVFLRQSKEMQKFLLYTSILKHFCASLCQSVTGRKDSAELLAELEIKNLFLIALDEKNTWYRYHPLFADLLLHHLRRLEPEIIDHLHDKAALWFLKADAPGEAIRYAMEGSLLEKAAQILDQNLETIIQEEGAGFINECLDRFPEEILEQFPYLAVNKAWHHLIHKGLDEAEALIDLTTHLEESKSLKNKEKSQEFRGMLSVVKAYYHIYSQDFPQALENAEAALQLLSSDNNYWRSKIGVILGDARLFSGNPKDAYHYYLEAHHNNQAYGNTYLIISTGFKVATTLHYMGRLEESQILTRDLLQTAKNCGLDKQPRAGLLWTLLGDLLREKGNLEEAERCVERGLLLSEPEKPAHGWNYLYRISLHISKQDYDLTLDTIKELENLHLEVALPNFIIIPLTAWKLFTLLALNKLSEARAIIDEAEISTIDQIPGGWERTYLALAQVEIEENLDSHRQVKDLLQQIKTAARKGNRRQLLLEALLTETYLEEREGNSELAEKHLKDALMAENESGYFQTFLDQSRSIVSVYKRVLANNKFTPDRTDRAIIDLAQKIYSAFNNEPDKNPPEIQTAEVNALPPNKEPSAESQTKPKHEEPAHDALIEELSARETEILTLLSQGLYNQQIAQQLFLSPGTVKWHASNIYGKLGVRGRLQAVALARKLKLIP